MTIKYHPLAKTELLETLRFYKDISYKLPTAFLHEYNYLIELIETNPLRNSIRKNEIRFQNFKKFPYVICYRLDETKQIRILAIRHKRRNADYGLGRD
ncbi:MAG: type II toxin-antitoxin system RelE/ParE family toxin [Lentisphaeria bacterium]|nr:type II toxin-antitoxin system RelE/ParE family toxin [Lentisphaeria bacterium]NQZ67568.1 type II toxin-antitoxin system RelE/ParE family toxin [Lentisphaeria bacterium]